MKKISKLGFHMENKVVLLNYSQYGSNSYYYYSLLLLCTGILGTYFSTFSKILDTSTSQKLMMQRTELLFKQKYPKVKVPVPTWLLHSSSTRHFGCQEFMLEWLRLAWGSWYRTQCPPSMSEWSSSDLWLLIDSSFWKLIKGPRLPQPKTWKT